MLDDYLQRKSSYSGLQGSLTSQVNRYHQLKVGRRLPAPHAALLQPLLPDQIGVAEPRHGPTSATSTPTATTSIPDVVDGVGERDSLIGVRLEENDDGARRPEAPEDLLALRAGQVRARRRDRERRPALRPHQRRHAGARAASSSRSGRPGRPTNVPTRSRVGRARGQQDLRPHLAAARRGVPGGRQDAAALQLRAVLPAAQPSGPLRLVPVPRAQDPDRRLLRRVRQSQPASPSAPPRTRSASRARSGDRIRLDVTAYYKDVKDLVEIAAHRLVPERASRRTATATSRRSRGSTSASRCGRSTTSRRNVNYSLSYAQGTGSVSNTQRNIAWTGDRDRRSRPRRSTSTSATSCRSTSTAASARARVRCGRQALRSRTSASTCCFNVASGTPFTPTFVYNEVTLAAVVAEADRAAQLALRTVDRRASISRRSTDFDLGGLNLKAFVWVSTCSTARTR